MSWQAWDLEYNAELSSERQNEEWRMEMNWIGLAHIVLPTFAFTNLLYIIVIRNYARKKANIITNLFCLVLIGQLFVCFGYQVGYLYYDVVNIQFVIFAVLICQNVGLAALSFFTSMIALVYYYIMKQDYNKIYKLFYGNQRWYVAAWYLIFVGIWLTLSCYHWIFTRLFFFIFIAGCLILHLIYYCKLGNYCLCCCNPQSKTGIKISVDASNVYYKIGMFGSILFALIFTILPIFIVLFDAVPKVLLAVLAGICHCATHVGFDYIASLDISNNIEQKAKAQGKIGENENENENGAPHVLEAVSIDMGDKDNCNTSKSKKQISEEKMLAATQNDG